MNVWHLTLKSPVVPCAEVAISRTSGTAWCNADMAHSGLVPTRLCDRPVRQAAAPGVPTLPHLAFTTALVTCGLLSPFNISILPPTQEPTWAMKVVIRSIPLQGGFQVWVKSS